MNEDFQTQLSPGSVKGAMKIAEATSRDLWYVDVDKVHTLDGFNVRVQDSSYASHIESLVESMLANGFYPDKPLAGIVNGDQITITDGHCRFAAVKLANERGASIVKVPIVTKPAGTSMEDLTVALVTSNSGRQLTPYETGVVCKRLTGFGWETKEVSRKLSISLSYVDQLLSLMAAPKELRQMVIDRQISAGNAIDLIAKYGELALTKALSALVVAEVQGKGKVTAKHLSPEAKLSKQAKKFALTMYEIITDLIDDPNMMKLKEETRAKIRDVMDEMDKVAQ